MTTINQIEIPTCKGRKIISLDNIIRIQANSNYCKIFLKNEYPITVAKVLRHFQQELSEEYFCRINRTDLINKSFIITSESKNSLKLTTGETFMISRRRVANYYALKTA